MSASRKRRKHVNPIKAFRLALSDSMGLQGDADASLLTGIAFGLWWCIAGVPVDRMRDEGAQ